MAKGRWPISLDVNHLQASHAWMEFEWNTLFMNSSLAVEWLGPG